MYTHPSRSDGILVPKAQEFFKERLELCTVPTLGQTEFRFFFSGGSPSTDDMCTVSDDRCDHVMATCAQWVIIGE